MIFFVKYYSKYYIKICEINYSTVLELGSILMMEIFAFGYNIYVPVKGMGILHIARHNMCGDQFVVLPDIDIKMVPL